MLVALIAMVVVMVVVAGTVAGAARRRRRRRRAGLPSELGRALARGREKQRQRMA